MGMPAPYGLAPNKVWSCSISRWWLEVYWAICLCTLCGMHLQNYCFSRKRRINILRRFIPFLQNLPPITSLSQESTDTQPTALWIKFRSRNCVPKAWVWWLWWPRSRLAKVCAFLYMQNLSVRCAKIRFPNDFRNSWCRFSSDFYIFLCLFPDEIHISVAFSLRSGDGPWSSSGYIRKHIVPDPLCSK